MRNILDKNLQKIKTQILCSKNSFRESFRLWNVEKHGTAGQATDDDILRFACRLTKVSKQTHTHNIYYLLLDN